MTLYSLNGAYPQELPFRIRLPDGSTRTDPATFTAQDIAAAGFTAVDDMPADIPFGKTLEWQTDTRSWVLSPRPEQDLQTRIDNEWAYVRERRNKLLQGLDWRYERYRRLTRLGLPQVESIDDLDAYAQALADIPQTHADPFTVVWPDFVNTLGPVFNDGIPPAPTPTEP